MAAALTVKDIKNKLKTYRYVDQASRDVHALISNFSSLHIRDPQNFMYPNGSKERLVSLSGTIPVKIRGTIYNIPIVMWLKLTHPHTPPTVYVTPTSTMGISPSQYVDTNGMVYLPYLTDWKNGGSDLTALSQILCATFADNCPVFSRQAQPHWQPPQPVQPPSSYRSPSPYTGFPAAQSQPPKPYSSYAPPYPSGGSRMPTPYSSYQQTPTSTSSTNPPYPVGNPTLFPQPPTSSPSPLSPLSRPPPSSVTASVARGALAAATAGKITAAEEKREIEESQRITRQSLETAVEDKIRRHVTAVLSEAEREMTALQKTQNELQNGSRQINKMMEEMENKQRDVEQGISILQEKNTELESLLEYLRAQPDHINVDEAVVATTPLYTQILQLYAEENAIEDTIYYLGEALRKGVIELEVFLKHVRELSRKQFMARATIMKARSSAGLPAHGQPV